VIRKVWCYSVCMTIKPHIKEIAEKRGVTTAYQLQKLLNIAPAVAARLWRGDFQRVDLITLDRLCEALECELSDLLVRVPNKKVGKK
jgi:putative transcriptional regulator